MEGEEAFNRALRTWARWVDDNIDPTRTRVFFRSISPEHKRYISCRTQEVYITADQTDILTIQCKLVLQSDNSRHK